MNKQRLDEVVPELYGQLRSTGRWTMSATLRGFNTRLGHASRRITDLSATDAAAPLGISDLELLAISAYLIGKDEISDDLWARAHNECLQLNNVPRAARCAFWLVLDLLTRGEVARAGAAGAVARSWRRSMLSSF